MAFAIHLCMFFFHATQYNVAHLHLALTGHYPLPLLAGHQTNLKLVNISAVIYRNQFKLCTRTNTTKLKNVVQIIL